MDRVCMGSSSKTIQVQFQKLWVWPPSTYTSQCLKSYYSYPFVLAFWTTRLTDGLNSSLISTHSIRKLTTIRHTKCYSSVDMARDFVRLSEHISPLYSIVTAILTDNAAEEKFGTKVCIDLDFTLFYSSIDTYILSSGKGERNHFLIILMILVRKRIPPSYWGKLTGDSELTWGRKHSSALPLLLINLQYCSPQPTRSWLIVGNRKQLKRMTCGKPKSLHRFLCRRSCTAVPWRVRCTRISSPLMASPSIKV